MSKGLNFKIFTGRQYQTQAFSQKGVQASWDAPRTKNGHLWMPKFWGKNFQLLGYSRKHPYHPHGGNWKLTPLPPSDVLIHLLLSETIFSPLPLRTAEISSVGGVWIFSGTTHFPKYIYISETK